MSASERPVPRGRPRDPKRREAVLAAARDLVDERGYAATTLQAISERSGVGFVTGAT